MKAHTASSRNLKSVATGLSVVLAALAVIVLCTPSATAQNRPFEAISLGVVTDLSALSNSSPVTAVGQRQSQGLLRARLFREDGSSTELPLAPGDAANTTSNAKGISDNGGDAVGRSGGAGTDWPNPNGPSNPGHYPVPAGCMPPEPLSINNSRIAVGNCGYPIYGGDNKLPIRLTITNQLNAAILPTDFVEGTTVRLPGKARDINNNGIIVGQQGDKAAIWTDPNQLPWVINLSEARGISSGSPWNANFDIMTVVGPQSTPAGVQTRGHAFLYVPGGGLQYLAVTRLPFFPFPQYPLQYQYLLQPLIGAETHKVNSSGHQIGHMKNRNGSTAAAIWNFMGQYADLTANTSGLPAGTVLTDAVDINNQGYVLAKGLVNGQIQGFILRPTAVPIPFTYGQYMY